MSAPLRLGGAEPPGEVGEPGQDGSELEDVLAALEGTGYHLELRHDLDGRLIGSVKCYPTELVARFRDDRRFPAAVNPVRWTRHLPILHPTWA